MKKCPCCGQSVEDPTRSVDISTRFHGWVTFVSNKLGWRREYVKQSALIKTVAEEIVADGGDKYPAVYVPKDEIVVVENDVIFPQGTSRATNKQMMSALLGLEIWSSDHGVYHLPERDIYG